MAVTLGIDIGTSSSKGVLVRDDGTVLATATRAHPTAQPRPGWFEHDPEVWWADVAALARELTAAAPTAPAAVAVTGLGPCVLPADASGAPLRPAILYGVDTRATAEIAQLTDALGADAIVTRCGAALSTQAGGPKLAWIRAHEPDVWSRTRRFFTASSFAVHRLTGAYVLDHHTASQYGPLYDIDAEAWIPEWAEVCAPGVELPALAWPGAVVGAVHADAAAATGVPVGTPVIAGTVDAWAEAESVGVDAPGELMLMYGTTMFLLAYTARTVRHPALWTTVGIRPGTRCLAGGLAASGAITDWACTLTRSTHAELTDAADRVAPGSAGLLVLPYFAGERTPIADPQARGIVAGLTLRHGAPEIYRAVLEGTAFAIRHNLDAFAAAGAPIERIAAVGGGTQGDLWPRIVTDVTGRAQEIPAVTIGAAYGGARLAAEAVEQCDPDVSWVHPDRTVAVEPAAHDLYARRYPAYLELYERTVAIVHELAASSTLAPTPGGEAR